MACSARRLESTWFGAALVLAWFAPAVLAQTYDVNLKSTLNGLDVKVETVPTTGMLVVKLTNNTAGKVRCDLRYDASPQPLYRTTSYVKPGATEQSVFRAKRKWLSVDVAVECKAAEG
jgi:hypothetical protein